MCARISTLAFIYNTKWSTKLNRFNNEQKNVLFVSQNIQLKRMVNTVMVSSDGTAKNAEDPSFGTTKLTSTTVISHGFSYGSQRDYLSDF